MLEFSRQSYKRLESDLKVSINNLSHSESLRRAQLTSSMTFLKSFFHTYLSIKRASSLTKTISSLSHPRLLFTSFQALKRHLFLSRSLSHLNRKRSLRLLLISFDSLKFNIHLQSVKSQQKTTALAFHDFCLKRTSIRSLSLYVSQNTLPKPTERLLTQKALSHYNHHLLSSCINSFLQLLSFSKASRLHKTHMLSLSLCSLRHFCSISKQRRAHAEAVITENTRRRLKVEGFSGLLWNTTLMRE